MPMSTSTAHKKLKILMVHPHDIYSTVEPWTIRITSIATALSRLGHDVKLVYFPLDEKHRGIVRPKFSEFETIPYLRRRVDIPINILKMTKLAMWADIIHFQKCYPEAALPAVVAAYLTGKHLHYDWDDWEYQIFFLPSPSGKPILKTESFLLKILEGTLPKLADTISVASNELMDMATKLGVKKNRMIKVNVCADLERFNPANEIGDVLHRYGLSQPIVTYLGQLHGAQYAELFLHAAKNLSTKFPKVNFLIIGGGDDLTRLKELAARLGMKNKIKFTGFVSDKDVNQLLAATDIAVACFTDTKQQRCKSPLKIAEYMASGKAVVASNVGEVPWMIGDAGITVTPSSHIALSEGILRLLNNKSERQLLQTKARARAEKIFNWKTAAKKIIKVYESGT
ncbi:MAG: glycosyltransferase family 4 protein [archaeon]